jgi:hypothetical protein
MPTDAKQGIINRSENLQGYAMTTGRDNLDKQHIKNSGNKFKE